MQGWIRGVIADRALGTSRTSCTLRPWRPSPAAAAPGAHRRRPVRLGSRQALPGRPGPELWRHRRWVATGRWRWCVGADYLPGACCWIATPARRRLSLRCSGRAGKLCCVEAALTGSRGQNAAWMWTWMSALCDCA